MYFMSDKTRCCLQSIRGDETVNVNKPSPVSPQLTARSGQSAQLVQGTHCIRKYVNLHSAFGHPCNGTPITWSLHDFILRAKEISRAFVYDDFLVSANGLYMKSAWIIIFASKFQMTYLQIINNNLLYEPLDLLSNFIWIVNRLSKESVHVRGFLWIFVTR
jgi:hypothetical protein